jgi:hypothetical protein
MSLSDLYCFRESKVPYELLQKFSTKEWRISLNKTINNSELELWTKDKILIENEKTKNDSKTLILFKYDIGIEYFLNDLVQRLIKSLHIKYGNVHYFAFMITYDHEPITYKSPHEIIELNEKLNEIKWYTCMLTTGVSNNVTKYKTCKEFYKQFYDKYDEIYFYTLKKKYNSYDKFNKYENIILKNVFNNVLNYFNVSYRNSIKKYSSRSINENLLSEYEENKNDSKKLIMFDYTYIVDENLNLLVPSLLEALYKKYGNIHYWAFMFKRGHCPYTYKSPHSIIELNEKLLNPDIWDNSIFTVQKNLCKSIYYYFIEIYMNSYIFQ